jgi:hypothetical protein
MKSEFKYVLIVLIGTVVALYKIDVAWFFLAACLAVFIMQNKELLESFSIFGLKATLKKQIDEQNATIDQLRCLAKYLALSQLKNSGYILRLSYGKFYKDLKEDVDIVREYLVKLGASSDEIEKILSEMNKSYENLIKISEDDSAK